MLREIANDFYMNQNYNCGECILRAANKAYDLGLDERTLKLASGFGAGMGCGNTCGALSAAMSVLSLLFCGDKAHETEGFKELCAEYVDTFKASLGSDNCEELKARYRYPEGDDRRCLITVERQLMFWRHLLHPIRVNLLPMHRLRHLSVRMRLNV